MFDGKVFPRVVPFATADEKQHMNRLTGTASESTRNYALNQRCAQTASSHAANLRGKAACPDAARKSRYTMLLEDGTPRQLGIISIQTVEHPLITIPTLISVILKYVNH